MKYIAPRRPIRFNDSWKRREPRESEEITKSVAIKNRDSKIKKLNEEIKSLIFQSENFQKESQNLRNENIGLKQNIESLQEIVESQKKEIENLKIKLEEIRIKLEETKMWKEKYKEGHHLWVQYRKKVELKDIKHLLKDEVYKNLLSKKLREVKQFKEQFDINGLDKESKPKSSFQIQDNQEGKSAKQFIIRLLTTSGSLEERHIAEALQSQGIQEGTTRQALYREKDKLFRRNTQGEWELRQ